MTVGERITKLRLEKNLTQKQLAEKIGYSEKLIAKWEADKTKFNIRAIIALTDFFDVTSDYLLGMRN